MPKSINVVSSPFNREGPQPIAPPPATAKAWHDLRDRGFTELKALGLTPWDEEGGIVLMLFPYEWLDAIPEGFAVVSIMDTRVLYSRATMGKQDKRMGALPFGIKVRV